MSRWFQRRDLRTPSAVNGGWHRSVQSFLLQLNDSEIPLVKRCVSQLDLRVLRLLSLATNYLSNGLLYPLLAMVLALTFGEAIYSGIMIATCSALAAHILYPIAKNRIRRARPFDHDPTIPSLVNTLDRYSFPSGHAMTATTVFVTLAAAMPLLSLLSVVAILTIGWARVSVGHHYPSDILAGSLMGLMMAGPGLFWLY